MVPRGHVFRPLVERFLAKTQKSEGCWLWTGATSTKGYGRTFANGRNLQANRVAYEMFVGPIAPGLFVCHRCDNPRCVNPEHLFLGTNRDNILDAREKGRLNPWTAHVTSCPKGHPYDDVNTYRKPGDGGRGCKECRRQAVRNYRNRRMNNG